MWLCLSSSTPPNLYGPTRFPALAALWQLQQGKDRYACRASVSAATGSIYHPDSTCLLRAWRRKTGPTGGRFSCSFRSLPATFRPRSCRAASCDALTEPFRSRRRFDGRGADAGLPTCCFTVTSPAQNVRQARPGILCEWKNRRTLSENVFEH